MMENVARIIVIVCNCVCVLVFGPFAHIHDYLFICWNNQYLMTKSPSHAPEIYAVLSYFCFFFLFTLVSFALAIQRNML